MKRNIAMLKSCPLFSGVEERELTAVLGCLDARAVFAGRGETVFSEGAPSRDVGVVLSGSVQIVQEDYYGNRTIVGRAAPGELFGESFACAGVDALPVSVIAAQPAELLLLDCRRIVHACCSACSFHSRIIRNLLEIMAQKNLAFHQKLQITSRRTTREKLMAYLLAQAKRQGTSRFTIPFDRQELADYLGVDRSGLSAEIGKLKAEGIIDCRRSDFVIL